MHVLQKKNLLSGLSRVEAPLHILVGLTPKEACGGTGAFPLSSLPQLFQEVRQGPPDMERHRSTLGPCAGCPPLKPDRAGGKEGGKFTSEWCPVRIPFKMVWKVFDEHLQSYSKQLR